MSLKVKKEKARYNFIKGQLYNEVKERDSANMAFDAMYCQLEKFQDVNDFASYK